MIRESLIPRTDHSAELYREAFSSELIGAVKSIADIGAGDSDFHASVLPNQTVLRIDRDYAQLAPVGGNYLAADATDMSSVPSESVDMTVSAFMFQHLPKKSGAVAQALREMVRITRPAVANARAGKGYIQVYPVYRPEKVWSLLEKYPELRGHAGLSPAADEDKLTERGFPGDTLMIRKDEGLDEDALDRFAEALDKTDALRRRTPHLGALGRMMIDGTNRINVS